MTFNSFSLLISICCEPPAGPILQQDKAVLKMHETYTTKKAQKTKRERTYGRCLRRIVEIVFDKKEAKRKYEGKKRCSCMKVGDSCLALCVWAIVIRKSAAEFYRVLQQRTWRHWRHVDVREVIGAGARSVSDPLGCGQVLSSGGQRRERNTFCTCFANAR